MKEKIIFAPGANGSELLRTMAIRGNSSIGVHIMGGFELAEYALMRAGKTDGGQVLSTKEQINLVNRLIEQTGSKYFSRHSFSDAENLVRAMDSLRTVIPANEEDEIKKTLSKGPFPEKNEAILKIYGAYRQYLKENGLTDRIDTVRRALELSPKIEADMITLREFPLTPLENALLNKVAKTVFEKSLTELIGGPKTGTVDYTSAYGESNEVVNILGYIISNGIPLDKCTVAVTDTKIYSQLFSDFAQQYNIPVTFGCGISIMNTNPAKLLKKICEWNDTGTNTSSALESMLFSPCFDASKMVEFFGGDTGRKDCFKAVRLAGQLRLGMDAEMEDIDSVHSGQLETYASAFESLTGEKADAKVYHIAV